jgi:Terminase large subunit, T4likevirus-type, N-terminal
VLSTGVCTFDDGIAGERRPESQPEDLEVGEFVRRRLGIEPDARQMEVLRSKAKRGILNCSRQWGKSTMAAAKAVHRAFTQEGKLVLVASPSERQSAEFLRKATGMVRALGIRPRGDGDNDTSLVFPNGSRIVGLPGVEGTVRGFSAVSLLLIDEAARVEDAMYKALRPMLAVGNGDLWLMSTPWGKRGFFYENWEHGEGWLRVSAPATECPRIPREFLEEERAQMGGLWFRQEYLCEFVDNGTGVFERELVEKALDNTITPLGDLMPWDV